MDEQTMVLIHTGIGLSIIVITALIAWHAPGPSDSYSERRIAQIELSTTFLRTDAGHKVRAKALRQAQGVPEGY